MQVLQRNQKTYNIATQLSQYSSNTKRNGNYPFTPNTNRLPKIIDVQLQDEEDNKKRQPFQNIFNTDNKEKMKSSELIDEKSHNVVGKKDVKAYQTKIARKKNIAIRRNESAMSISRISTSVKSQNQTGAFLNKQDVLGLIRANKQNQTSAKSPNDTYTRNNQMMTFHSNQSNVSKEDFMSIKKCKDKLEYYTKTWQHAKQSKKQFPSILDQISKFRTKMQTLQAHTLEQMKKNTKQSIWNQTLRTQKNATNFYNQKCIQKIVHSSELKIKGHDKLAKQTLWVQDKDKMGHVFSFLDDFTIKITRNSQELVNTIDKDIQVKRVIKKQQDGVNITNTNSFGARKFDSISRQSSIPSLSGLNASIPSLVKNSPENHKELFGSRNISKLSFESQRISNFSPSTINKHLSVHPVGNDRMSILKKSSMSTNGPINLNLLRNKIVKNSMVMENNNKQHKLRASQMVRRVA